MHLVEATMVECGSQATNTIEWIVPTFRITCMNLVDLKSPLGLRGH